MSSIYFVPSWFVGTSAILEFFFFTIALIISFYANKIYTLTKQKEHKFFSIGFLLISLSYLVLLFLNLFFLTKRNNRIFIVEINQIISLTNLIFFLYSVLFIMGLVTLVYMAFELKNAKLYVLLTLLGIVPILFSTSRNWLLYPISAVFLLFLSIYFLERYYETGKTKTLISFIAFVLLLLTRVEFVFASKNLPFFLFEKCDMHFIIAHLIESIAYLLLLFNLINILKNDKKKKQT